MATKEATPLTPDTRSQISHFSRPYGFADRGSMTAVEDFEVAPRIEVYHSPILVFPSQTEVSPLKRFLHKYFYFLIAILCIGIKVASVIHTPSYAAGDVHHDSVFDPEEARPWILWLHNIVFSAWLLFFAFQSGLVHTCKVRWHRAFGWLGASLALIGIATAIVKGRMDIAHQMGTEAEAYLIIPFFNMLAFAAFCALAVRWRQRPELHRQLIFFATCGLLDTAFLRYDFIFRHAYFYQCIDTMILLGAVRSLYVFRRIPRLYLVALPALIGCQAFVIYTWTHQSAWWARFAHTLIG